MLVTIYVVIFIAVIAFRFQEAASRVPPSVNEIARENERLRRVSGHFAVFLCVRSGAYVHRYDFNNTPIEQFITVWIVCKVVQMRWFVVLIPCGTINWGVKRA